MACTGRCGCGAVTLEIAGDAVDTRICWCRQCQKIAAGGPTHNAIFHTDEVVVTGSPATFGYVAASGNTLTQWFCAACGSPVMAASSARPHYRTIRFGMLDAPHGLRPAMAIWLEDAPDWAVIDPALERHDRQPPPPGTR